MDKQKKRQNQSKFAAVRDRKARGDNNSNETVPPAGTIVQDNLLEGDEKRLALAPATDDVQSEDSESSSSDDEEDEHDEELPQARPVKKKKKKNRQNLPFGSAEPIETTDPDDDDDEEEEEKGPSRRLIRTIIIICEVITVVVIVAVVVVVVLRRRGNTANTATATGGNTTIPTMSPTSLLSSLTTMEALLFSLTRNISPLSQFIDTSLPQGMATMWITTEDTVSMDLLQNLSGLLLQQQETSQMLSSLQQKNATNNNNTASELSGRNEGMLNTTESLLMLQNEQIQNTTTRILQRYSLAVFYFSTRIVNVTIPYLNSTEHECDWSIRFLCNDDDQLTGLLEGSSRITGPLPLEIGLLTHLNRLVLPNNDIGGSLPTTMEQMSELTTILLSNCSLTGTLPPWTDIIQDVLFIDLSNNFFTGTLPSSYGDTRGEIILTLDLSHNMLSGSLNVLSRRRQSLRPVSLLLNDNLFSGGYTNEFIQTHSIMARLDLSRNVFTQELPTDLVNAFLGPKEIDLQSNAFFGTLPDSDTNSFLISNIEVLLLSDNQLTGTIPTSWQRLTDLRIIDLSRNANLTGTIPLRLFFNSFPQLQVLLLADNPTFAPGPLPELSTPSPIRTTLTDDGWSLGLRDLSLRNTSRTGTIPSSLLCRHELLTWLDLSHNQLTGTIPKDFCDNAPRLKFIQLQNNQLTGNLEESCFTDSNSPPQAVVLGDNTTSDAKPYDLLLLDNNNFVGSANALCQASNFVSVDCFEPTSVSCDCCTRCCAPNGANCHPEHLFADGELDPLDDYARISYDFGGNLSFPFEDTSNTLLPCSTEKRNQCCADSDCQSDQTCAGRTCVERGELRFTIVWTGPSSLNIRVTTPRGETMLGNIANNVRLFGEYTQSITLGNDEELVSGMYKYSVCCGSIFLSWTVFVFRNEVEIARHNRSLGIRDFEIFIATNTTLSPSNSPSLSMQPSISAQPTMVPSAQPSTIPTNAPSDFPSAPVAPVTLVPTIGASIQLDNNINLDNFRWEQVGPDIVGLYSNAQAGTFVAITPDGSRIAFSAPGDGGTRGNGGYVEVYDIVENSNNGTKSFVQVGQTLENRRSGTFFGISIDLSDDGTTIAIGSDPVFTSPGFAWVYRLENDVWVQLGSILVGAENGDGFGFGVLLSQDGRVLAVEAPQSGKDLPGYAMVFEYDGQDWVQLGRDLVGDEDSDSFGFSFGMSADGTRIAISATQTERPGEAGYVRTFDFNGRIWIPVGQTLVGSGRGDNFGSYVAMSPTGLAMAIGALQNDENGIDAGQVQVFELSPDNEWIQKGQSINGVAAGDNAGWSCSISSDATILAVGSFLFDSAEFEDVGQIRVFVFDKDNNQWIQVGNDLVGENEVDQFGNLIALSGDGSRIVAGTISFGTFEGRVQVFDVMNNPSRK